MIDLASLSANFGIISPELSLLIGASLIMLVGYIKNLAKICSSIALLALVLALGACSLHLASEVPPISLLAQPGSTPIDISTPRNSLRALSASAPTGAREGPTGMPTMPIASLITAGNVPSLSARRSAAT